MTRRPRLLDAEPITNEELDYWRSWIESGDDQPVSNAFGAASLIARLDDAEAEIESMREIVKAAQEYHVSYPDSPEERAALARLNQCVAKAEPMARPL